MAITIRSFSRGMLVAGLVAVLIGGMPSIAHAVNYTWDASGGAPADDGSGTWSSTGGTNWLTGSTYGAWGNTTSDVAFFGVGSGAAGTVTVSGSVTTNGITFNNAGSSNYTLSGGTIGFGGTTPTITVNDTGTSSIASLLSGTVNLRKAGAGTLSLSGVGSTLTAGFTQQAGVIINSGSMNTGSAGNTGNVTVSSGTYINQGQHRFVGSLTVSSGAGFVNSGTTTMIANSFLQLDGTSSGQNTGTMTVDFLRLNGSSLTGPATFVNSANGAMTLNTFVLGNGGFGSFTNDGGRLTVNSGQFTIGKAGGTATGTSSMTVNSGTVTNNNSATFRLGDYSNGSNTTAAINLNGGLFETVGSLAQVTSSGSNNAASINFNGGTLRGLTNNATLLASSLTGVTFAAGGGTIDLGSGITSTAAANFSGVGGFTKSGSGTLILTGSNNTNVGTNAVTGGILQVGNGSSLAGSLSGNIVLSNTATLAFSSTANQSYAGVISGTGLLTKTGAGSLLTLSGNGSVVNGGITISSGAILNTGSISTGSGANTGNVNVDSGTYTNQGQHQFVGSLSVASGASVVNSGTMTMGGGSFYQVSGTGAGQNTGTMNLNFFRLNGGGDAAPSTFVNGVNGSMAIDSFILGDSGYGSFTNDGGRLTVSSVGQFTIGKAGNTTAGTSTLTVNSGTITNNNSATLRLGSYSNGSNAAAVINLNGGLFETAGSLALTTSSGSNNSAAINFNGGTLRGLTNGATLLASNLTGVTFAAGGGTIDLGNGITSTAAASLTGVGGLTKTGSGTLILTSSNNTYAGNTAVAAGILQIGDGSTLAGSLPGNAILQGGTLAFASTANQAYAGVISGTGGLTKSGTGSVLTLSGNGSVVTGAVGITNTATLRNTGTLTTGAITVNTTGGSFDNQGRLTLAGNLTNAAGAVATLTNSGTITESGGQRMIGLNGTGGFVNSGNINLSFVTVGDFGSGSNAETATFTNNAGSSATVANLLVGRFKYGTFTNDGGSVTPTVQLSIGRETNGATSATGTSTFNLNSGTVTMGVGTFVRVGGYGSASNTMGVLNLNGGLFSTAVAITNPTSTGTGNSGFVNFDGGTLRGTANNVTLLGSDMTGVALNAGGGTIDLGAGITNTIAAAMSGAGGLTKTGSGVLQLTGGNTYAGLTSVDAGTLRVNGLLGVGGVSVASGALLAGSGTIGGAVSVLAGGIVDPGNSPGTLTVNDAFSLASTSVLHFELNAANNTAGSGINDLITGVTNLTLDGFLDITGTGDWTSVANGTAWRLFNYTGTLSDNGLTIRSALTLAAGQSFQISTATANEVNVVVVPEPGAVALAGLGAALAGWMRYRRRR